MDRPATPQWRSHVRRLAALYGLTRALAIVTHQDPQTEADVAAWLALGRREAA